MDIVGGVYLASPRGGEPVEAKVVTGVDDHSRFCVIATVVPRASGRAVCLALVRAMRECGVPEEILSDDGKQFTDRFGKGGEVLLDRICRDNGTQHRLTAPASPTAGHGHAGVPVRSVLDGSYAAGQADLPLRVPSILAPTPPAPVTTETVQAASLVSARAAARAAGS